MIYCYVGLPGSGKTFLAQKHQKELGGIVLDDTFTLTQLNDALKNHKNIFVCDPMFCNKYTRMRFDKIVDGRDKIEWLFFENDPDKAYKNIEYRNDNRLITYISVKYYWSKTYDIPNDVVPIKIWQTNQ